MKHVWDKTRRLSCRYAWCPPTEKPLWADSTSAASTISLRWMILEPLLTALQVITTLGLQSMILWERDSAENPANTT